MASSQESVQKLKEVLRTKGTQIMLGAMVLLLCGRIYYFMSESAPAGASAPAQPTEIRELPSAVHQEVFDQVNRMISPMPDFTTTTYYRLSQFNMFDPRQVLKADTLVGQASQYVTQAQTAFAAGQLDTAQKLLDEAFKINPSSIPGWQLRTMITAKLTGADAATSATATAAPGATPGAATPGATPGATPTPAAP